MLSAYAREEVKVQKAMRAYNAGFYTNQRTAAAESGAKPLRVRARLNGIMSKMDRPAPNKLLTVSEEAGLILWLDRSAALHLRTTKQMLENECNSILSRRVRPEANAPPRTCGEHWSLRFLQDYPRFVYRIDNPKELAREAAEDRVALTGWFAGLKETIEVNNIEVRDTYNYDETGIRLGIGKKEKVIVEATRGRIESSTTTTRESCTLGECISADGDVAPPLLVLKGKTH